MGRFDHYTEVDRSLTHQVVFQVAKGSVHHISVSCNCQAYRSPKSKIMMYASMGLSTSLEESRKIYNDPTNHSKPFGEEDKAKW